MNKLFDITGKVVVITGGTGILGKAIAKYLALEGAKPFCTPGMPSALPPRVSFGLPRSAIAGVERRP